MYLRSKIAVAASGIALLIGAGAAQAEVLFWSTQAKPVEEAQAPEPANSIAEKLERIRAVVSGDVVYDYSEDEHASELLETQDADLVAAVTADSPIAELDEYEDEIRVLHHVTTELIEARQHATLHENWRQHSCLSEEPASP